MNGENILLDTNAVLYFLNGRYNINSSDNLFVSIISEMELLCYPKITQEEEIIIKNFLHSVNIIGIDSHIKNETISIKKEINIKLPDAIILATAKVNKLILLTQDALILKHNNYKSVEIKKCFND